MIGYKNFWIHPEKTIENFFLPLFEAVFNQEVTLSKDSDRNLDIELISVFKPRVSKLERINRKIGLQPKFQELFKSKNLYQSSSKKVWFTGENKRPPFQENYDAYLGFERDGLNSKCIYLPLWVLNLNWFGKESTNHRLTKVSDQSGLTQRRNIQAKELINRKFCCIFVNNPENIRMEMIHQLKKIGQVDIYGGAVNNFVKDKLEVAKNYKFILSFENSLYPGYVTEKLLESYESTAFPLYWGIDRDDYFNPSSNLNFTNFANFESFLREIERLNNSLEELASRINEPLLQRKFDLTNVILELRKLLVN